MPAPAGASKITVNTTANVNDGACEGAPNSDEIGNCTLREAIDLVNNGDVDIITFHPPVFSSAFPGVISLCGGVSGGDGDLPIIDRDVVIDATNTGVILDGGTKDVDCTDPATWGIYVLAAQSGLDFALIGGDPFLVRDIDGDGIIVDCNGFSFGTISITGVTFEQLTGVNIATPNCPTPTITPTPTMSSTPTVTPTPTKQPDPGDTDGDGCSDQQENGPDETLGGQRDYRNPHDFYDVLGPGASLPRDGIVDLPNDILTVIRSFSPTGAFPYNILYDRGPSTGPNPWNMTAPDGVIDLPNDILGVILQFQHDCR